MILPKTECPVCGEDVLFISDERKTVYFDTEQTLLPVVNGSDIFSRIVGVTVGYELHRHPFAAAPDSAKER